MGVLKKMRGMAGQAQFLSTIYCVRAEGENATPSPPHHKVREVGLTTLAV